MLFLFFLWRPKKRHVKIVQRENGRRAAEMKDFKETTEELHETMEKPHG